MKLSKREIKEHKDVLIADGYIVYLPWQERPRNSYISYCVSYDNKLGVRCCYRVDNKNRNIYVDIDYIGLFK